MPRRRPRVPPVDLDPARRGRPPVTGTTRDVSILVRVTRAEREELAAAARRLALPLGAWTRSTLLAEARRRTE